ncbi:SIMPL domain-containing protein [Candidatus Uhrbacteria bacterium]|nr:SIMPL domain-containing protein [Candidatus Uhrbacteria bacterium]
MANNTTWWQSSLFKVLSAIILGLVALSLVAYVHNEFKRGRYIGRPAEVRDTITINGEGKVTAIPDTAYVTLGLTVEKKEVAQAQKENNQKMNDVIAGLKNLGIKDADIQTTDYRINTVYDYVPAPMPKSNSYMPPVPGRQVIRGYEVSQSVRVKIKNLDKIGDVLTLAGGKGLNQVSGVSFDLDDPEKLKQMAREKALNNAKEKAQALARVSGARLGKIVSFSEYGGDSPRPMPMYYAQDSTVASAPSVPQIQGGTMEITITATVSYEIL